MTFQNISMWAVKIIGACAAVFAAGLYTLHWLLRMLEKPGIIDGNHFGSRGKDKGRNKRNQGQAAFVDLDGLRKRGL